MARKLEGWELPDCGPELDSNHVMAICWGMACAGMPISPATCRRWLGYATNGKRWLRKCRVPKAWERAYPERPYAGKAGDPFYVEMCAIRTSLCWARVMHDNCSATRRSPSGIFDMNFRLGQAETERVMTFGTVVRIVSGPHGPDMYEQLQGRYATW